MKIIMGPSKPIDLSNDDITTWRRIITKYEINTTKELDESLATLKTIRDHAYEINFITTMNNEHEVDKVKKWLTKNILGESKK